MGAVWTRIGARLYEPFPWLAERRGMEERRRRLLAGARGRVLEIGAGTGLNLDHYPSGVDELVLAEPARPMAQLLAKRIREASRPVQISLAPAEQLPFSDDSFDTVVSTMVLCTVPDPGAALAEVRRVLRPGGRLLFCEHVRAESPRVQRWQRRMKRVWSAFAQGCRCDRRLLEEISSTFDVQTVEHDEWRGMPALVRPLIVGHAVPIA